MSIPKPSYKRRIPRAKNNPWQTEPKACYICGTWSILQRHEVYGGNGRRQLSIRYGMQADICDPCHDEITDYPMQGKDLQLKKEFQQKFIEQHGYDEWMKIFKRDYSETGSVDYENRV